MSNTPSSLEIINITGSFDTTTKKFVSLKINDVVFEEKQPKLNLIECVKAGNLENVKKCLAENQDPNMTDNNDRNMLCIAVGNKNKKIVEEAKKEVSRFSKETFNKQYDLLLQSLCK